MTKRRRIYIDLTEEQYKVITSALPRGYRQGFFEPIIENITELLKDNDKRDKVRSAIISRQVSLWNIQKIIGD